MVLIRNKKKNTYSFTHTLISSEQGEILMKNKLNILFIILGWVILLVRIPLVRLPFISQMDFGLLLLLYVLYSCVFITVYFLILEFNNFKSGNIYTEIAVLKYALKYLVVFIVPTILDQIIISLVYDNAVNQLVWLVEDGIFFGIDYISILLFICLFRKTSDNCK